MGRVGLAEIIIWIIVLVLLAIKVGLILYFAMRNKRKQAAHMEYLRSIGTQKKEEEA